MEQVEDFMCPFCDFSDHDSYFLLQHVELCHPENGDSPFIAKHVEEPASTDPDEEGNTRDSTDSPSGDDIDGRYVVCPRHCGETVNIAELSSHVEMHLAEGMMFDGTGGIATDEDMSQLHEERALIRKLETHFDTSLPDPLRNCNPPSGSISSLDADTQPSRQKKRDIIDWKRLLLGSESSRSKHNSGNGKHATIRRLGVGIPFSGNSRIRADILSEGRAWATRI